MPRQPRTKCIGILTSGGDCPGLNAAIRAIAKSAIQQYGMRVIGFLDGFRGLIEKRHIPLRNETVSGILTLGGTILGTSRDKPNRMLVGGRAVNMIPTAVRNARSLHIDCLVCLGGGGTLQHAYRLAKEGGLNVMHLPKTIDNDVAGTDVSFGFDTALGIATEAIDRLHTTATSHHRIIVCEVMGHKAGWLTLGAGVAGGADVILIPEIPYDVHIIGKFLAERRRAGKRFSIIAVAEGAQALEEHEAVLAAARSRKKKGEPEKRRKKGEPVVNGSNSSEPWHDETREGLPVVVRRIKNETVVYHVIQEPRGVRIARQLQEITGTEVRFTALGHVQRGGSPSTFDRMLCTVLGTKATQLLAQGTYNVMVAYHNGRAEPVPIELVAGKRKTVPMDHPLIESARLVGSCFGDQ